VVKISASNYKWDLAVAVPISNPYFRHKNRFSAQIDSIAASRITLTSARTESVSMDLNYAHEFLAVDDLLTIKSATTGTVNSTYTSSITTSNLAVGVDDDLTATFAKGDTVVGYGSGIPGGWYLNGGDIQSTGVTFTSDTGAFDDFCLKLYIPAASFPAKTLYIRQDLSTTHYIADLHYRLGFKYKYLYSSNAYVQAPPFGVGLYTQSDSMQNTVKDGSDFVDVSSWTNASYTMYLPTAMATAFNLRFILIDSVSCQDNCYIYLDEVYLEHIYNTASQKTIYGNVASSSGNDTTVGYYEIDSYPEEGSVKWEKITSFSEVDLIDGGRERYDSMGWGERNVKYELSARFVNVPTSVWNKLESFLRIQQNGNKLNLHPYINELPSVLTGYLYITGVDYTYWDLNYVSFDFKFREA